MNFDIAISFLTPSGHLISGFVHPVPLQHVTLEHVESLVDLLQNNMVKLSYITIFTRDRLSGLLVDGKEGCSLEQTLAAPLINQSIMSLRIVQVAPDPQVSDIDELSYRELQPSAARPKF